MKPKFHPELPLGPKFEMGDAQSFIRALVKNKVDLSKQPDQEKWKKRILTATKN